MIFTSHFLSMVIYAVIVSILIAFIRYDNKREIFRYSLKLFIYMVGGVIIFSWFMYFF
jgi:uncharacterized membrane protein